jgi:hypothetical protein
MITRLLWRHLRHPNTDHALFRRLRQPNSPPAPPIPMLRKVLIGMIGLVLLLTYLVPRLNSFPMALLISGVQMSILGVALYSSIQISIGIANELNHHTATDDEDLLRLTPMTALGILWLIAGGYVHRGDWLTQRLKLTRRLALLMLILIGLHMLDALRHVLWLRGLNVERTIMDVVSWVLTGCTLYLAFFQTVVIAVLIGIVAHGYVRRSIVFWTAIIHTVVIAAVLIGWGLLHPIIGNQIEPRLGFNAEWMLLTPLALIIQELVIALLWSNARQRLSDDNATNIEALLSP